LNEADDAPIDVAEMDDLEPKIVHFLENNRLESATHAVMTRATTN
jgi:hypothetical protein